MERGFRILFPPFFNAPYFVAAFPPGPRRVLPFNSWIDDVDFFHLAYALVSDASLRPGHRHAFRVFNLVDGKKEKLIQGKKSTESTKESVSFNGGRKPALHTSDQI